MTWIFLAVVIPIGVSVYSNKICDNDSWTRDNRSDTCYYVSTNASTWVNANDMCTLMQSHLVDILNERDQVTITRLVSSHATTDFWIGLVWTERKWRWQDGSQLGTYNKWAPGQNIGDTLNRCVRMNAPSRFWSHAFVTCNNITPSRKTGYICEKEATEETTAVINVMTYDTTPIAPAIIYYYHHHVVTSAIIIGSVAIVLVCVVIFGLITNREKIRTFANSRLPMMGSSRPMSEEQATTGSAQHDSEYVAVAAGASGYHAPSTQDDTRWSHRENNNHSPAVELMKNSNNPAVKPIIGDDLVLHENINYAPNPSVNSGKGVSGSSIDTPADDAYDYADYRAGWGIVAYQL